MIRGILIFFMIGGAFYGYNLHEKQIEQQAEMKRIKAERDFKEGLAEGEARRRSMEKMNRLNQNYQRTTYDDWYDRGYEDGEEDGREGFYNPKYDGNAYMDGYEEGYSNGETSRQEVEEEYTNIDFDDTLETE